MPLDTVFLYCPIQDELTGKTEDFRAFSALHSPHDDVWNSYTAFICCPRLIPLLPEVEFPKWNKRASSPNSKYFVGSSCRVVTSMWDFKMIWNIFIMA